MAFIELEQIHQTYAPVWAPLRLMQRIFYQQDARRTPVEALKGVDLSISAGTITGLLGPPGSGKSTLLRIVAGLLRPTRGHIRIDGLDPFDSGRPLRGRVGVMMRQAHLFRPTLTGEENLRFHVSLHSPPVGQTGAITRRHLHDVGLDGVENVLYQDYTPDMRQRLAVARMLLGDPDLLIMDEATAGLDPVGQSHFYGFLLDHVRRKGCTVLYATHDLNEAQFLCNEVAIMKSGRVVAHGPYLDLQREAMAAFHTEPLVDHEDDASAYPGTVDERTLDRVHQAQRW